MFIKKLINICALYWITLRKASIYKMFIFIWTLFIVSTFGFNIHALLVDKRIETDLISLLPKNGQIELQETQKYIQDSQLSKRIVVMIGHTSRDKARAAFNEFQKKLLSSDLSKHIELNQDDTNNNAYKDFFKSLYPFKNSLLSHKDHYILKQGKTYILQKNAFEEINSMTTMISLNQMTDDPFFLYNHYVQSLVPPINFIRDNGFYYVQKEEVSWYFVNIKLRDSGFSLNVQNAVGRYLNDELKNIELKYNVNILKTGVLFFALNGFDQANKEISTIGLLSIMAIIALFIAVFKSLNPLIFALCVILSSLSVAIGATLLVFHKIHVISILFGSSLLGMTVDYVIHTCLCQKQSAYKKNDSYNTQMVENTYKKYLINFYIFFIKPLGDTMPDSFKKILPSLFLSALSSSIGYAVLIWVPFPGIQEMAIIGSIGLLSAFISVVLWGKYFIFSQNKNEKIKSQLNITEVKNLFINQYLYIRNILFLIFSLMFILGLKIVHHNDDIRYFQAIDSDLKSQETKIKSLMGQFSTPSFFVVKSDSMNNTLALTESLIDELNHKFPKVKIKRSISFILPSKKRQIENNALQQKLYDMESYKLSQLLALGYIPILKKSPLIENVENYVRKLPAGFNELIYFEKKNAPSSSITARVFVKVDNKTLQHELRQTSFHNAHYIDMQEAYSDVFKEFRQKLIFIFFCITVSIFIILSLIKSFKNALYILTPIFFSMIGTFGTLSCLGFDITLFHYIGLLIVLCVGLDYSLFFFWNRLDISTFSLKKGSTTFANSLCALTTLLSFGMLALSQTKAVHDFGITIFIGIIYCIISTYIHFRETSK